MKITDMGNCSMQQKCVLALGNFDGVHLGHRRLLEEAAAIAGKAGVLSGVYTFRENSKSVLAAENFSLLTTEQEKEQIISECGADFICCDDFSKVRGLSPEEFCGYIAKKLDVKAVVCGENYTFGKNASAGSEDLKRIMQSKGIETHVIPSISLYGDIVSSTRIRNLISCGDVEMASELLGYRYFIKTKVVHGKELGRQLGFPTVNQLEYENKTIPKFGVYACVCTLDEKRYKGVVNVGVRPTVSQNTENPPVVFETHLLDYAGNAYGKSVCVEFCKMLREEKKFASLDELRIAVMKNIDDTYRYFEKAPL